MNAGTPTAAGERWLVVGAGSAGCVVAARLSEDPGRSVTLFEAGPDLVPGAVPPAIDGSDYLAAIDAPGRTHAGLVGRRTSDAGPTPYPTGRGVGGSSAVYGLLATRGDPDVYREWGWTDADEAWARVAVPVDVPDEDELGVVDRALLAAAPDARRTPLARRDGRRVTSAEAYLWPVLDRPNLVVRPESPVDRIRFDGRRATGVVLAGGAEIAGDHVVLAAGAIHGPAILLRSGVETAGIGEGLQDHPSAAVSLHLDESPDGPTGVVSGAFLRRGGIQILAMNRVGESGVASRLGQLVVGLMLPRGRAGRVSLRSDDPNVLPDVRFDQLEDPADLAELRAGVRLVRDLLDAPPFRSITATATIDEHGTPIAALADDATIDRWLRSSPGAFAHASSSCAMGRVVDGDGALVGYDRLRVCDASVFPSIPDTNTHLPTTMLAERLVARW